LGIDDPTLAQDDRGLPSAARGPRNFYGDIDLLQSYLSKWQSADFLKALWAVGLPAEPVLRPGECWDDEQTEHNEVVVRNEYGTRHVGVPIQGRVNSESSAACRNPIPGSRLSVLRRRVRSRHSRGRFRQLRGRPAWVSDARGSGCEVIKVEALSGDPLRGFFRAFTGSNRGKRGLAIDLKTPEGVAIAHRLCASAHIVHHNFRPGVAEAYRYRCRNIAAHQPAADRG